MTFLALAVKCGFRGATGSSVFASAAKNRSLRMEARPMLPRPTEQSLKNWRRVRSRRIRSLRFMENLVQVRQSLARRQAGAQHSGQTDHKLLVALMLHRRQVQFLLAELGHDAKHLRPVGDPQLLAAQTQVQKRLLLLTA